MPDTTTKPAGLVIEKRNPNGWRIYHESSGLPAGPYFDLKRQARILLTEMYETGCDFTAEVATLRSSPQWPEVYRIVRRWENQVNPRRGESVRMTFWATRNSDGTIHVTNTIGGMSGQHHVHDAESWDDWKRGDGTPTVGPVDDRDIQWLSEATEDCTCGEHIWRRQATS
jgi:hypothetical protein